MYSVLTLSNKSFPHRVRHLGEVGPHGQMVEVSRLGREPERRIRHDVAETGWRKVEADATNVLHRSFRRIKVLQNIPIASELKMYVHIELNVKNMCARPNQKRNIELIFYL